MGSRWTMIKRSGNILQKDYGERAKDRAEMCIEDLPWTLLPAPSLLLPPSFRILARNVS